tara:strand:- start:31 stop:339 length:309 start_codon:yes stop_codon:yes gene_type:complete
MITIEDAILALVPNAEFVVYENKIIQWDSEETQPTESEIATKKTELETEYDNNAYARARAIAYPSITEFMEAYTEKEIGGDSTKWDAYVVNYNKVRTDNPKG